MKWFSFENIKKIHKNKFWSKKVELPQFGKNKSVFKFFVGISYMQAQCEINLTEDHICIEIKGREKLSVFIDDAEQDAAQNICELKQFNESQ